MALIEALEDKTDLISFEKMYQKTINNLKNGYIYYFEDFLKNTTEFKNNLFKNIKNYENIL